MKMYRGMFILCIIVLVFAACGDKKDPTSAELEIGGHFALTNGVLIDGTGADPLANAVILVREGTIEAVCTEAGVEVPDEAAVIDVQGTYILPGFMNTHVHSGYEEENLRQWARSGVTTVRDLVSRTDFWRITTTPGWSPPGR